MIPLALIPWRLLGLLALLAGLLGASYLYGHRHGAHAVQSAWDQDRLALLQAHADKLQQAIDIQRSLQALIDQGRKDRAHATTRIDDLHTALLDGLRQRPETRADTGPGVPAPASDGVGCTGAGLARPDAGFLAGYAADAAKLHAALQQCRAGYQAAQQRLDAIAAPAAKPLSNGAP